MEQFDVEFETQLQEFIDNLIMLQASPDFVQLVREGGFERLGRPWLDLTRTEAFKSAPALWRLLEDLRDSFHEVLVDDQDPDAVNELVVNEFSVTKLHEAGFSVYHEEDALYIDMGEYLI